jgi:hypothetical protein
MDPVVGAPHPFTQRWEWTEFPKRILSEYAMINKVHKLSSPEIIVVYSDIT